MKYQICLAEGTGEMVGAAFGKEGLGQKECRVMVKTDKACHCLWAHLSKCDGEFTLILSDLLADSKEECIESMQLLVDGQLIDVIEFKYLSSADSQLSKAEFPDQITDVIWNNDYCVGTGIDAVTNHIKKSAVVTRKKNETDTTKAIEIISSTEIVQNANDYSSLLTSEMSGRFTVAQIDFTGYFQYLQHIKYSEKSISVILKENYREIEYTDGITCELSEDARALSEKDAGEFRNMYGDYYVSDEKRGGYFIAVFNCEANSVDKITNFKAGLNACKKDLFNFVCSGEFQQLASTNQVRVSIRVNYYGCDSLPNNIDTVYDVKKALDFFNKHKAPIPYAVKMNHYSCLNRNISKEVPYEYDVLKQVKLVYSKFWKLYADIQVVHKNYRAEIIREFMPLYDDVTMNLSAVVNDNNYRKQCLELINSLQEKVVELLTMYDCYRMIQIEKKKEPQPGEKQKTDERKRLIWSYGCFNYPHCKDITYHIEEKHGPGYRQFWDHFNDPDKTIVGYKVISNWMDGTNGDWWKLTEYGLLDHRLDIRIDSYFGRGFSWDYVYYTVDNKYINFGD